MAGAHQATVAVIRILAKQIKAFSAPEPIGPDVADAVDALLDRSIGAEEYVIRAAPEGIDADPLLDLGKIDFDALALQFAGRKRTESQRLASLLA